MSGMEEKGRGKKSSLPRPFPAITPQSYLPGSDAANGGLYPGYRPPPGANQYPGTSPNSMQPPIRNYDVGTEFPAPLPPPPSYNPMLPPTRGRRAISNQSMNYIQRRDPPYDQRFPSYSRHRPRPPVRVYRRGRSNSCRPIVRIIRTDSCSSISTCSSTRSCSPRYRRQCPYSTSQQPQQQPIIFLPIQCPQQPLATTGSTPLRIQPLNSMSTGKPQQIQAGPIQYVQANPNSTSQLQYISGKPISSTAPQRVRVNSTHKKKIVIVKPIQRYAARHNRP